MRVSEIISSVSEDQAMQVVSEKGAAAHLEIYSDAKLVRDIEYFGHIYPKGSVGQIVEVHGDHVAYEVEFVVPFAVITIYRKDLVAS